MMAHLRLLDLYCGAGGAAMGYHRAGFAEIVGVDIAPQPRYPFTFVQGDAIEYALAHGHEFDVLHASPPCQRYSSLKSMTRRDYPDLIAPTRDALIRSGKPYVIENVPDAPLVGPIMLCGLMFGLRVLRHRLFETNFALAAPAHPKHDVRCAPQGRRASVSRPLVTVTGHFAGIAYAREAMGIGWMTRDELAQAIPPAYTEYIGRHLMESLNADV